VFSLRKKVGTDVSKFWVYKNAAHTPSSAWLNIREGPIVENQEAIQIFIKYMHDIVL